MSNKSIVGLIPFDTFKKADDIIKMAGLKHKIDGFRIMNGINPPQILNIKKIRFPSSKKFMLQIDVRHILKL